MLQHATDPHGYRQGAWLCCCRVLCPVKTSEERRAPKFLLCEAWKAVILNYAECGCKILNEDVSGSYRLWCRSLGRSHFLCGLGLPTWRNSNSASFENVVIVVEFSKSFKLPLAQFSSAHHLHRYVQVPRPRSSLCWIIFGVTPNNGSSKFRCCHQAWRVSLTLPLIGPRPWDASRMKSQVAQRNDDDPFSKASLPLKGDVSATPTRFKAQYTIKSRKRVDEITLRWDIVVLVWRQLYMLLLLVQIFKYENLFSTVPLPL